MTALRLRPQTSFFAHDSDCSATQPNRSLRYVPVDCRQKSLSAVMRPNIGRSNTRLLFLEAAAFYPSYNGRDWDNIAPLVATAHKVREQARHHGEAFGCARAVELALDFRLASLSTKPLARRLLRQR
ncbi:hypothetical protein [Sphingomonas sp. PB4P5]|uniref:hypothetical protein n=1 Tax=Parasphingomonas puruogangriensis TaxID=3096155 RepID=UPI002FCBF83B